MKLELTLLLPVLATAAKYTPYDYASGKVHMMNMGRKESAWAGKRAKGDFDSWKWPSFESIRSRGGPKYKRDYIKCVDGLAIVEAGNPNQTFACNNVDMYDFKSHADLGSWAGEGSDTWGWTSDDGREFIAIGQADGTAFCEISSKGKLIYLGRLPQQSVTSIWHDIKGIKHYIVVGSEAEGHGIQVFDMKKLLDIDPGQPKNFSTATDLTGWFNGLPVGSSHNLVAHEEKDYIVAVGAQPRNSTCRSGLIYIDMSDPSNPTSSGCAAQDGYSHDAQCVTYRGPDSKYSGRDICYSFNEDTLTIYDVTDRTSGVNSSSVISRTPYTGATYCHQGWLLDENWQQYLFSDDELDELDEVEPAADGRSVMYIWDISSLEAPVNTGYHKAAVPSIDHNLYVHDGLAYQSNYGSGLRVLDVSGVPEDPTGGNIEEAAFFDIYPEDDAQGGIVEFVGTWSNYLFPSGYVVVNTIERGAFVLKLNTHRGKAKGRYW